MDELTKKHKPLALRMKIEADAGGAMTEGATDLMMRLTIYSAKEFRRLSAAEVVNSYMGTTISLALSQIPHDQLSAWLRGIADAVDEQGAERAKHAN